METVGDVRVAEDAEQVEPEEKPTREAVLAERAMRLAHRAEVLRLALRGMESHLDNGDDLGHKEILAATALAEDLVEGLLALEEAIAFPRRPLSS